MGLLDRPSSGRVYISGKDTTNFDGDTREFSYIPFRIFMGVDVEVDKDEYKFNRVCDIRLKFGEHRKLMVVLERD